MNLAKEKVVDSERMAYTYSWTDDAGWNIYFLGTKPGVYEKAVENLKIQHSELRVAGMFLLEYGFEKGLWKFDAALATVVAVCTDLLLVCQGAPKLEKLVHERLGGPKAVFSLCVGAAADFAAGYVKLGLKWLIDCGFEWLCQFSQGSKRLFGRYFAFNWSCPAPLQSNREEWGVRK